MPYNTTAIPPPEEINGRSALPPNSHFFPHPTVARIKKIIHLDEDIAQCSSNATFVVAVATEMFIRYLAEQGHNVVKSERKPRRNIQYRDLAAAVSRIDNLEFLSDVIPKTTTYKQFKEKRAKENGAAASSMGQRTLDGRGVEEENGALGDSREDDSTLHLNGDTPDTHAAGDGAGPASRAATVSHMLDSQSTPAQEDSGQQRRADDEDEDVDMID
ncbi:hypothetical protein AJ80_01450 [Polytolypa hystricis UAMH7299]|uniref:Transcription factor CBF/NF-Y/archaeal histone domain-containing protein n=1 Tax=Polytolypa hystricis (strain UAMH7299) TaxID=1447883 RepID=A0A2B7Z167_POLH7|nr:hypothetical protein AJ80_01450 [Polytolypa hystricis UAMH7299]